MKPIATSDRLRVLCVAETWEGSDAYAFVKAFRRQGHSVQHIDERNYFLSVSRSKLMRAIARIMAPIMIKDFERSLISSIETMRPQVLFVFKGTYVTPRILECAKQHGTTRINFFPDTSAFAYGPWLPKSLPMYDWIFNTKSFGIEDMRETLGITNSSFVSHSYDPTVHAPIELSREEQFRYGCDVSFIGTWTPKKEEMIQHIVQALPEVKLKIWGNDWQRSGFAGSKYLQGYPIFGREYAKAIRASKVNLGLLIERQVGASFGDLITARTFHIPAAGGFMLHERTSEYEEYFRDQHEAASFATSDELVQQVKHYLANEQLRNEVAERGYQRCVTSGYDVDTRAKLVVEKANELINSSVVRVASELSPARAVEPVSDVSRSFQHGRPSAA